ncbi:TetR family transcriptional regulator [Marinobacter halodurans]|uniref:TetR family transcriptional regulator n=1 Tax=Marinobacter halodurans TaxID=2528979 RepID=A0ABY1ZSK0_9GAMM|nr:TetR family transcriptional regulator [Marinobacter halodurans]TBW59056.1 TetR family transcriptional regulator [Marinobacter halodurans]
MTDDKPEAESVVGGALQESIHYHGRKAARAKSETRRRKILEAALEIAAHEGVRGIKHRPVAKRADVPLASTTYYFKDIEELIQDAFMLFAEKANRELEAFYKGLNSLIDRALVRGSLHSLQGREQLAVELAAYIARYFVQQIRDNTSSVLTEQAFLAEAMREPGLESLAKEYRKAWLDGVEAIMKRLGTNSPRRDAALLISVVSGMGYDGLLFRERFSSSFVEGSLQRVIGMLMGVAPSVSSPDAGNLGGAHY